MHDVLLDQGILQSVAAAFIARPAIIPASGASIVIFDSALLRCRFEAESAAKPRLICDL
jgi:hypothetical protein